MIIQIRITPFEKRRLEQVAQQNNQSVSDFIREAVNEAAADCDSAIFKLRKKTAA